MRAELLLLSFSSSLQVAGSHVANIGPVLVM